MESVGILIASGLIAGEALTGLVVAYFKFRDLEIPQVFASPSYLAGLVVMALLGFLMVKLPLSKAGRPEDPAAARGDHVTRAPCRSRAGGRSRSMAVAVRHRSLQLRRQLDRSVLHQLPIGPGRRSPRPRSCTRFPLDPGL